jgi:Tfp pilus assembly protein PilO
MAEQKMTTKFPRQSLIYLLLCLTGILTFILAGILPNIRTMAELSTKTTDVQFQLEEQRELSPFQKSLQDKSEKTESEILPLPAKGILVQTKIDTLPMTFSTTAKMSGMSLVSAIPNLNALTGDAQSLSVNVVLRGDFINLRKFLITLGGIPYMKQIEEIAIQQKPDTKEFRLKVWVAVG